VIKMPSKKSRPKIVDNDIWLSAHFEEIIDKYAGQYIIISNGEIFTGEKAFKKAKEKYPRSIPLSMPVPRPEDFVHILICTQL
jgi:hypothetical protein